MSDAPKLLMEMPVPLRWRDLDALNHVNNAAFLTFLEEARLHWFAQLDGPWFGATWMPVLAAIQVNYRAQLSWPGQIVVRLFCERLGNASLTIAHRIVDAGDPEKVYSDGSSVLVWVDPAHGKSVPLPDVVRAACA